MSEVVPNACDLTRRARSDLERLKPETWIEVYGTELIDGLEESRGRRLELARVNTDAVAAVESARRMCDTFLRALASFQRLTSWERGRKGLKATPKRWVAAQALATAVSFGVEGFVRGAAAMFVAGRRPPGLEPESAPSAQSLAAAEGLEAAVRVAEEIMPEGTSEKVDAYRRAAHIARDAVLLRRHPIKDLPEFKAVGSIDGMVSKHGQCEGVGPGGRCWLYQGHPGDHQYRKTGGE